MKLPLYEIQIDEQEELFVDAVALVDSPAIESNFLAFSKTSKELSFSLNEERKELLGAAAIPFQKIYRKDENGTEYEVFFSDKTIREIAQLFFRKNFQGNINLNHTEETANAFIFQSYIVDEDLGIKAPKGIDVPNGSWIIGMKVQDNSTWEKVKSKEIQGFSMEGIFNLVEPTIKDKFKSQKQDEEEVLTLLQNLNAVLFKKEKS